MNLLRKDWRAELPVAEGFDGKGHLPFSSKMRLAEQLAEMGLRVGDVIVGREAGHGWWHEEELTVLCVGKVSAFFGIRRRNHLRPEWHEDGEASAWTLSCRKWFKKEAP